MKTRKQREKASNIALQEEKLLVLRLWPKNKNKLLMIPMKNIKNWNQKHKKRSRVR